MDYANAMLDRTVAGVQNAQAAKVTQAAAGKYRTFEELRKAGQGLEAFFMQYLMKAMRKTVQKSGLLSGGHGEQVFNGFFDREIADRSAESRDLGIARMVVSSLVETLPKEEQEKAAAYINGVAARRQAADAYSSIERDKGEKWLPLK